MNNKRYRNVLFFFIVIPAIVAGAVGLRGQSKNAPSFQQRMTGKQKEHSKLYKGEQYRSKKKIKDLLDAQPKGLLVKVGRPLQGGDPAAPPFNFQKFMSRLSCSADAIVIGTVKSKSSNLTEDEDFIFTDYEIKVDEVLKNNPAAPIIPLNDITITRPGGSILFGNKLAEAIDVSFKPLELEQHYVLFLKFIPSTGAYKAVDSKSSYQILGDKLSKLTEEYIGPNNDELDTTFFLNEIRSAANCNNAQGDKSE